LNDWDYTVNINSCSDESQAITKTLPIYRKFNLGDNNVKVYTKWNLWSDQFQNVEKSSLTVWVDEINWYNWGDKVSVIDINSWSIDTNDWYMVEAYDFMKDWVYNYINKTYQANDERFLTFNSSISNYNTKFDIMKQFWSCLGRAAYINDRNWWWYNINSKNWYCSAWSRLSYNRLDWIGLNEWTNINRGLIYTSDSSRNYYNNPTYWAFVSLTDWFWTIKTVYNDKDARQNSVLNYQLSYTCSDWNNCTFNDYFKYGQIELKGKNWRWIRFVYNTDWTKTFKKIDEYWKEYQLNLWDVSEYIQFKNIWDKKQYFISKKLISKILEIDEGSDWWDYNYQLWVYPISINVKNRYWVKVDTKLYKVRKAEIDNWNWSSYDYQNITYQNYSYSWWCCASDEDWCYRRTTVYDFSK